jgi:SAM-dependent methyltransferase
MQNLLDDKIYSYFIEYDGVRVLSRQSDRYPNPTLNHFALANYLKERNNRSPKFIDLGCGVGFLGNYAAKNLDTSEIVFADLNPDAINQSLTSYQINTGIKLSDYPVTNHSYGARIKNPKHTLDVRVGDAAQSLANFDAQGCTAVAAPMYIPGACEVFPQAFMFFAYVAKRTGANLYFGHSNLSSDMIDMAAHKSGLVLRSKEAKEVPFMVEYTDGRDELTKENLVSKGLIIKKDGSAYHKLMVSELSYR